MLLESREAKLNARDITAVDAFRAGGVIGPNIVVEHGFPVGPKGEPLLWVPDIVAGAIGAELDRGEQVAMELTRLVTCYQVKLD